MVSRLLHVAPALKFKSVNIYTGYMAINAVTGITHSWIMGQGHCVAALDSVNLLLTSYGVSPLPQGEGPG